MGLGFNEILIIFVVILILFGAKRIPELMRSVGSGISQFKKGIQDGLRDPGDGPRE